FYVTVNPSPICTMDPIFLGQPVTGDILAGTPPFSCTATVNGVGWMVNGCNVTGSTFTVTYPPPVQPADRNPHFTAFISDSNHCQTTCNAGPVQASGDCFVVPLSQSACVGSAAAEFCAEPTGIGVPPFTVQWDDGTTCGNLPPGGICCFTPSTA